MESAKPVTPHTDVRWLKKLNKDIPDDRLTTVRIFRLDLRYLLNIFSDNPHLIISVTRMFEN
jgi:hypothetical protein